MKPLEEKLFEYITSKSPQFEAVKKELAKILLNTQKHGDTYLKDPVNPTDIALNLLEDAGYLKPNDQGRYRLTDKALVLLNQQKWEEHFSKK